MIFKKVFGQHPDILKSFLNSMLPLPEGREIVELEYLSPEMIPETYLEKFTRNRPNSKYPSNTPKQSSRIEEVARPIW